MESVDRANERPVVRLRPTARRRAGSTAGAGLPWHYQDEIVLDRRTRAIPAGAVVTLEDAERRPLGTAAFNAASKITVRMLDDDPAAAIAGGADTLASRTARGVTGGVTGRVAGRAP